MSHPLDRPAWNALAGDWAAVALGDGRAKRVDPRFNVFGAAADFDAEAQDALARLVRDHGALWVVEPDEWPAPPGCRVIRTARLAQMVCEVPPAAASEFEIVSLGEEDGAEMRALVAATKPGPFAQYTHRTGDFVGVREGGRLVAMAGERMRPAGFAEVSGVCTDPAQRGRGLAGALIGVVARRIAARGDTAWLTSYADNEGALGLYRALGFVPRRAMTLTVLDREI